jgi:hypothetical protein
MCRDESNDLFLGPVPIVSVARVLDERAVPAMSSDDRRHT